MANQAQTGRTRAGRTQTDRSQLLMTYTTFHIGVYITLGGGGLLALKAADLNLLLILIVCFLIAGLCGGVIASNLMEWPDFETFREKKIGFWGITNFFKKDIKLFEVKFFTYSFWAFLEQFFFWLGLLSGLSIMIAFWDPQTFGTQEPGQQDYLVDAPHALDRSRPVVIPSGHAGG